MTLLVLLLAGTLAVLLFASLKWQRKLRPFILSVFILTLLLLVLPVGDWVLYPWENRIQSQQPKSVDGIIILGGAVDPVLSHDHNQIILHEATERLTSIVGLSRKYPKAKIIFSGGSGDIRNQDKKESDYVEMLFNEWHIKNVVYERQSRNTFENAVFSKEMIQPKPSQTWLLVTSASHMPRAKAIFDKQGWAVTPYPVDYNALKSPPLFCFCIGGTMGKLDTVVHEWIGIAAYRMTGKI